MGEMTLAELARRSGEAESNWHVWFRGEHRPRAKSLTRASEVLGLSVEDMHAAWDGEKPPKRVETPAYGRRSTDPLIEQMAEMNRINAELVASLKQLVQTHVELQAARQEEWLVDQDQTLAEYVQRAATEQAPTKLPRPRVQPSEPRGR